jgi:hypothetical protein
VVIRRAKSGRKRRGCMSGLLWVAGRPVDGSD